MFEHPLRETSFKLTRSSDGLACDEFMREAAIGLMNEQLLLDTVMDFGRRKALWNKTEQMALIRLVLFGFVPVIVCTLNKEGAAHATKPGRSPHSKSAFLVRHYLQNRPRITVDGKLTAETETKETTKAINLAYLFAGGFSQYWFEV